MTSARRGLMPWYGWLRIGFGRGTCRSAITARRPWPSACGPTRLRHGRGRRLRGWQEAEVRAHNEQRRFQRPRAPWYTDTPAWYPGPSPWRPDAPEATAAVESAGGGAR